MNEFFSSTEFLLVRDFAIALSLGALIGVEREHQADEHDKEFGGLRTFTLCALFGALAGWLDGPGQTPILLTVGLLGLIAILGVAFYLDGIRIKHVPGLTSELAAVITYLLGGAVLLGHAEIAIMLAISMLALLALKRSLHKAVRQIDRDDLIAGLKLLAATFIVLPLLPDHAVDPWGALNPYKLWWLVILISALSLIGYVAVRLLGTQRGIALTGMFGGLVSSTAVTLTFARRSKEQSGLESILAVGILLAWSIMFVRVIIEVAVVNVSLLPPLIPPLVAMFIASAVALIWFARSAKKSDTSKQQRKEKRETGDDDVRLKNPFSLTSAIHFGLVFAVVLLVVKLFQLYVPENWLYMIAALAGTTDVDAITLSLADTAVDAQSSRVAILGILIAAWSNTVVKCGLVFALGSRALALRLLLASLLIIIAGAAVFVVIQLR